MRHAIFVAAMGPLADPFRLRDVARAADENGWDGVFLWDHVLRPETDVILDTWVALAAVAMATENVRLGAMVTPVSRRRPIKLAREAVSVDLLSRGRLTLGFGLGVDSGGELSRFGEVVDARTRGAMLDEGAGLVAALLAGETVEHRGEHFTVDGVALAPRPHQRPRPPIWFAARGEASRPVRRAARYEGIFPIDIDGDRLEQIIDVVVDVRGSLDGFDIVIRADDEGGAPAWADTRATWLFNSWPALAPMEELLATIETGPPR